MSNTEATPVPAPEELELLDEKQQDQVAGGLNPQPLPPGRSRLGQ